MQRLGVLALVASLAAAGCAPPRPNVLLITFDTTRWDHMGYAGGPEGVTPTLDALAAGGTWFSQAITVQPLTLPSHTSIMTGQFPHRHGVRNNGTYVVGPEVVTLAERLADAGYATQAMVSAYVLDSQFGLDQGFEGYDDDLSAGPARKMFMFQEVRAEDTADKAIRWLEQDWDRERPFFLWLHFFDPHANYEPPDDVAAEFTADPYSGEIHYADRELGRVIAALDEAGARADTLVAYTADHGDALGDHGEKTHGLFIYDATMRVPLLLNGPGIPAGERVDSQVRTVDLAPTVLDLLRLDDAAVRESFDGRTLRPLWNGGDETAPRTAYLETWSPRLSFGWSELRGLREEHLKVILAPRPEAYDLGEDPGEHLNLVVAGEVPEGEPSTRLAELRELAASDRIDPAAAAESLDEDTRTRLAALGYVFGGDDGVAEGDRPDPKDRLPFWEDFQQAQQMVRDGRFQQAVDSLSTLVELDPDHVVARSSLAGALRRLGELDGALLHYREILARDPHRDSAYLGAARILRARGELDEAEALLESLQELQPRNPDVYAGLAEIMVQRGQGDRAEELFRRALDLDPAATSAATGLGDWLNRTGRVKDAFEILAAAEARAPNSALVKYNLGVVSERLGNTQRARSLYQDAVRLDPLHSMSWNNLGSLFSRLGDDASALAAVQRAKQLAPGNLEATYNLAVLRAQRRELDVALELFDQALAMNPDMVAARAGRAQVLEQLDRDQEALADWRVAAVQEPAHWVQVARLELERDRSTAARAALRRGVAAEGERFSLRLGRAPELAALLADS